MVRLAIAPPPGVVSDDTAFSLEMRASDANNMRWVNGSAQTVGGWNKIVGSQMSGVCRNTLAWLDNSGFENIGLGTHTNLYALVGGLLANITPLSDFTAGAENGAGGPGYGSGDYGEGDFGEGSGLDYFPLTWSLANWGENMLANPRQQSIFVWENDTSTEAARIANAPDNVMAMLVTPERQVLALGCNEEVSGTFNPRCIRGCDIEDYDDWTTAPDNNAFEHILEASGGARIITGRMVGPYVVVWTDFGLFLGQFLGDPGQTYRFDLIATNCGLIGPNAVVIQSQRAWWWTPDHQCYTWSPGEMPAPVTCPIREDFRTNISTGQFEKIAGVPIGKYGEIWWLYPDARDGLECSRYLILGTQVSYNQSFWWSRGHMDRSAAIDAGPLRFPIMASPTGYVYSHEDGNTADGGALAWSLTIALPTIDQGGQFVMIKGIEPDFQEQTGPVSVAFSLKKYPQSTAYQKGPYMLTAGAVRKHFTCTGRSAVMEFSGDSAPNYVRFGKPVLLVEPMGGE
jgi:hypothetical protein